MNISHHTSHIPWPKLIVLWSIHGDEPSGTIAWMKFREILANGQLILVKWSITIITHCNQAAFTQWVRSIDKNLNRCFQENNLGESYEDWLARSIMIHLKEHDYLLDLHSTSWKSIPFMFCEKSNLQFAQQLLVSHLILGWWERQTVWMRWDTESFMNSIWKMGFTFEAWNHNAPEWADNAYQAILNFVSALWLIAPKLSIAIGWTYPVIVSIDWVYTAKSENWNFAIKHTENFYRLNRGDLIGYDDTIPIYSDKDSILLLPKWYRPKIWEEIFFYGSTQSA